MGIKYSQKDLNFIKNNYKTMSNSELGKKFGITDVSISAKLKKMGLKKSPEDIKNIYEKNRPSKKYSKKEMDFILNNYKTMSNQEIGKVLNLTREAIRKKLKRLGIKKSPEDIKINYQNNKYKCVHIGINHPLYGKHRSEEVKEKIRKKLTGVPLPKERTEKSSNTRKKLFSEGKIKIWNEGLNIEEILKHYKNGFPNTGVSRPMSEEGKRKISLKNTGKKRTEECKLQISETRKRLHAEGKLVPWNLNIPRTEEVKQKISLANTGKIPWNINIPRTKECKQKISVANTGKLLGNKNPAWIDGRSFEPYCPKFNKNFKFKIRARDGFLCLKCGMREEDHIKLFNCNLHSHHINYDKKLTIKENCCALCMRCNIEVNGNRSSWIKFFQSILSERYGYQYTDNGTILINSDQQTLQWE